MHLLVDKLKCLFIFYGQSHEIFVISIGVLWLWFHQNMLLEFVLWLWFHQNMLLEFCKSVYKVKLDIAVEMKSVSTQYEMWLLVSISVILHDPFFIAISTITHSL